MFRIKGFINEEETTMVWDDGEFIVDEDIIFKSTIEDKLEFFRFEDYIKIYYPVGDLKKDPYYCFIFLANEIFDKENGDINVKIIEGEDPRKAHFKHEYEDGSLIVQ